MHAAGGREQDIWHRESVLDDMRIKKYGRHQPPCIARHETSIRGHSPYVSSPQRKLYSRLSSWLQQTASNTLLVGLSSLNVSYQDNGPSTTTSCWPVAYHTTGMVAP
jgi:hypothetical protein